MGSGASKDAEQVYTKNGENIRNGKMSFVPPPEGCEDVITSIRDVGTRRPRSRRHTVAGTGADMENSDEKPTKQRRSKRLRRSSAVTPIIVVDAVSGNATPEEESEEDDDEERIDANRLYVLDEFTIRAACENAFESPPTTSGSVPTPNPDKVGKSTPSSATTTVTPAASKSPSPRIGSADSARDKRKKSSERKKTLSEKFGKKTDSKNLDTKKENERKKKMSLFDGNKKNKNPKNKDNKDLLFEKVSQSSGSASSSASPTTISLLENSSSTLVPESFAVVEDV